MKLMQSSSRKKSKLLGGVPKALSEKEEQLAELERREKALVEREGHLLQQRCLMQTNQSLLDRRFFNGMVTFLNKPLER